LGTTVYTINSGLEVTVLYPTYINSVPGNTSPQTSDNNVASYAPSGYIQNAQYPTSAVFLNATVGTTNSSILGGFPGYGGGGSPGNGGGGPGAIVIYFKY
jgi:hypothetical protein